MSEDAPPYEGQTAELTSETNSDLVWECLREIVIDEIRDSADFRLGGQEGKGLSSGTFTRITLPGVSPATLFANAIQRAQKGPA